jgi:hypothetical protein
MRIGGTRCGRRRTRSWRRSASRAVASTLNPKGRLILVNWHARPRDETTVLGQPRGPKTELRLEPGDVQREVEPAGLLLSKVIELPPYHYGAIFRRSA